jgi:toxin-antitoxin system PIN domain toxin
MLIDANVLLYAVDQTSPFHTRAKEWLERALNGTRRIGIPWPSLWAFLRIVTNPRALEEPLRPAEAWQFVDDWLSAPTVWIPEPAHAHAEILSRLVRELDLRAGLIPDAVLAALCIEHGISIVSADSDFARFTEITWINPLTLSINPGGLDVSHTH